MSRKTTKTTIWKKMALAVTVLAAFGLTTGTALAGQGFGPGHGAGGMKALAELDLDTDQKAQIRDVFMKYREEMQAVREEVRSARRQFREVLHSDGLDEGRVRAAFKEMTPVLEDAAVKRGRMRSEIMAILTEAQRNELEEAGTRRKAAREKRRQFRKEVIGDRFGGETE